MPATRLQRRVLPDITNQFFAVLARAVESAAGYTVAPELIATGCNDPERVRLAAQAMLNLRERPTAFFASNNQVLQGVMLAVRNHGLNCPRDISITGFDGMGWADLMDPPMTTVEQAASEMGAEAVRLLIHRLQGNSGPPRHIILPTQFLVRSSSIPPQKKVHLQMVNRSLFHFFICVSGKMIKFSAWYGSCFTFSALFLKPCHSVQYPPCGVLMINCL